MGTNTQYSTSFNTVTRDASNISPRSAFAPLASPFVFPDDGARFRGLSVMYP